ncbi:hypothetical protein XAUC_00780 [Xanthomonas citri pv. aurantifolii str. ICPB 10535]|nr:hypothetical protein XAUC_00780 [Xanthomonas citri pv. aurantifolii str. ICPB 10535]
MNRLRAVVKIKAAFKHAAIAVGPASRWSEGIVARIAQQHLPASAQWGDTELDGQTLCIANIVNHRGIWVGHASQLPTDGVVVTQHQGFAITGLHLPHQVTEAVVAVLGDRTAILHLGQAPNAKRLTARANGLYCVVGVSDVEATGWIADLGDAIKRIVAICTGVASRIGLSSPVACAVVGVGSHPSVWTGELHQIAEAVVFVFGVQALGVSNLSQVVQGIMLELGFRLDTSDVLQRARQAVEGIKVVLSSNTQRINQRISIAAGVIPQICWITRRRRLCFQLTQLIVDPRKCPLEHT